MSWHQLTYPNFLRYTNGPRLLRSSSQNFLAVPGTSVKYGDRAFSAAAPRLWNQLPPELRAVTSVDQLFRKQLKTYLFKLAYDV